MLEPKLGLLPIKRSLEGLPDLAPAPVAFDILPQFLALALAEFEPALLPPASTLALYLATAGSATTRAGASPAEEWEWECPGR